MIISNFKKISIAEKGVILMYNGKESKEISFLDINKICIKAKKIPRKYIIFCVCLSLGFVLFLVWIYGFNLVAISPSFLIAAVAVKLNTHKIFVLKIKLNNGCVLVQPIPLKSKYKTIEDINKVRKVLLEIG